MAEPAYSGDNAGVMQHKAGEASFQARFTGEALKDHLMPVRDLAPALLALADAIDAANEALGKLDEKPSVNIRATSEGSVIVDLVVAAALIPGATETLLSTLTGQPVTAAVNLQSLVQAVGQGARVLKWLDGRKPISVKPIGNGDVRISLSDGTRIDAPKEAAVLIESHDYRVALGRAARITNKPGIHSLELSGPTFPKVALESGDVDAIRPDYSSNPDAAIVLDETHEVLVKLVQVPFSERLKWRVTENSPGSQSYTVTVVDPAFLKLIDSGEPFRKDDTIRALQHTIQRRSAGGGLETRREFVEILEHYPSPRTGKLF